MINSSTTGGCVGEKKIKFTKDWLNADPKINRESRKVHRFEQMRVTRSEDLPQLLTSKEAAEFLRRHVKTVEEYRRDGSLKFIKVRGRYFTTPMLIGDFLENESRKK